MYQIDETSFALLPSIVALSGEEDFADAEHNILYDDILAREVARGERTPIIRVWRHAPKRGLVVSKRDVSGANQEEVLQQMERLTWPVIVRPTGGTAVPHGQGVLNLSLLLPREHQKATTDGYYRLLCGLLIAWLESLGLEGTTGALPGSYCDGNYNVLVDGQKLVGTAQAWRGGLAGMKSRHPGFVLAHACIVIDVPLDDATKVINRFYELVGDAYRVDVSTSTTLKALLERHNAVPKEGVTAIWAKKSLQAFLQRYCSERGVTFA